MSSAVDIASWWAGLLFAAIGMVIARCSHIHHLITETAVLLPPEALSQSSWRVALVHGVLGLLCGPIFYWLDRRRGSLEPIVLLAASWGALSLLLSRVWAVPLTLGQDISPFAHALGLASYGAVLGVAGMVPVARLSFPANPQERRHPLVVLVCGCWLAATATWMTDPIGVALLDFIQG